ncbi:glycosyl hydrolase family 18, partial [Mediterraneibacter faecis]|nr:glycosyl hydrolase family 18 [Mediterraneibacter faecis]
MSDYLEIMAYDEHTEGSYEAGSVASISYLQDGIEKTLKKLSADKVIAGIPFFTRLLFETAKSPEQLSEEAVTE